MSIESNILMNMYFSGFINKKEEKNMAKLKSLYDEYIISFDRKESKWEAATGGDGRNILYNYSCNFCISNNLGFLILEISTTELDIFSLIDNLYQLLSNSIQEVYIPIKSLNLNYLNQYYFYFKRNENNIIEFYIYENNIIYNSTIIKLKILFDEKLFDDFLNIMYFIFLVDIDTDDGRLLL